jgi:type I restriction enzyme S subunit
MALCDRLEAARNERESRRDRLVAASLHRLGQPADEDGDGTFRADARFYLDRLPRLTTRPDHVKQLCQTILNLAVRGRLLPQDPADVTEASISPALRPSGKQLAEDEIPFDLPAGWRWVRFAEVATFENGDRSSKYPKRTEYVEHGVPWINTGHIMPHGSLSIETMNYITPAKFNELDGGKIRPGDILYCLRGATFGKTAFVEPFERGAIASSLMIIRPKHEVDRRYTYVYLISPFGRSQLQRFDNGTAQPNLASASVKQYLVPLPPLAEQRRIVAKVDELMALCDRLEASLAETEADSRRLLEAVLHQALEPTAKVLAAAE